MASCSLCEVKFCELYKPEQNFLGINLCSIIKFIFGGYVEFPPSFLICPTCAASLIQTELVVKRLIKALPSTRNVKNERVYSTYHAEKNVCDGDLNSSTLNTFIAGTSILDTTSLKWTFYCTHCEFKTNRAKVYIRHLLSKHKVYNPRIYQCMYCEQTYQRINAIHNHISCVHGNKPKPKRKRRTNKTAVDDEQKYNTTILNTISEGGKDGPKIHHEYKCLHCEYKTEYPKMLKRHLHAKHQIDDLRIYKCNLCSTTYARQHALRTHIAKVHKNESYPNIQEEKPHIEDHVAEEAKNKIEEKQAEEVTEDNVDEINNHDGAQITHNDRDKSDEQQNKEHIFQIPQKKMWIKSNLSEVSTSKWIFQCMNCEFETEKKKKYRTHLSIQHGIVEEDFYKCLYCSASYERYIFLHDHMTNKHSIDIVSDTSAIHSDSSQDNPQVSSAKKRKVDDNPGSAKFNQTIKEICVACGKKFSSVEKLRVHVEKHHEGEEFQNSLNYGEQRRSIEKNHTDMNNANSIDTMLTCQIPPCIQRFNNRSMMKEHMYKEHLNLEHHNG